MGPEGSKAINGARNRQREDCEMVGEIPQMAKKQEFKANLAEDTHNNYSRMQQILCVCNRIQSHLIHLTAVYS